MRKLAVLFATALCAVSAFATEVVIKNDSFASGGSVNIEAGFAMSESAAAWLTTPYDGTIVAVQVYWTSLNGGAPPTLGDSITIFSSGTFPDPGNPGAPLAVLEAPVMNDGYMNEFRYLDEQQTIPLLVPVTAGQQFIVSFKFADAPPPSGPSVVVDTDGCQAGKNAIFAIPPSGWFNACDLGVTGDFVIRAVVDTGAQSGACCLPDGSCAAKTQSQCTAAGGTFQGNGTTCGTVQCPQPTGACCIDQTHGCLNLTQADCTTVGGRWGGAGTSCTSYVCFPSGACCKPDGSCVDNLSPTQCSAIGGTFQGNGTQCSSVNCPPPAGACCISNGGCLILSQANCTIVAGTWAGPGTDCADHNNNGRADACENLRLGDMNCDGFVNFGDINPFVQAISDPGGFIAGHPDCPIMNADCNHDGRVDFGDINDFVALLAGG